MDRVWSPIPLRGAVFEIIQRSGSLTDMELLSELRKGKREVSFREVNAVLMKLEVCGFIHVSRQMKGQRLVELAKEFDEPRKRSRG